MSFIVRHETDGYIGVDTKASSSEGIEDLSSVLRPLSLSPPKESANAAFTGFRLNINEEGQTVPLESTLEIKTCVAHKSLSVEDIAPQLWISQTPKLVRAYHNKSVFQTPIVEDVKAKIKEWEGQSQTSLGKLVALIKIILDAARKYDGGAPLQYDVKSDSLMIRKTQRLKMLPKDLYSK